MATDYSALIKANTVPASSANTSFVNPTPAATLPAKPTTAPTQQSTVPPPPTPVVDSSKLGANNTITLPDTQPHSDSMSILASIPTTEQVQADASQQSVALTPAETEQNNVADRLKSAYQKLTGKQEAQLNAEQSAGVPGFTKQLNDINNQIQTLQKEAQAIPLIAQNMAQGRGMTAGGLAPLQAEKVRNNTIQALGLSAIAQTLQGNLALAQKTADRAVELEFAPVQAEIDYLSKVYEINKDTLERTDKKRAEALQIGLQERQRLLDEQKDNKKTILGFAAEASKNGASSLLINKALATTNPQQALSLLSGYMSDPVAKQQALANLNLTRAQTAKALKEAQDSGANIDAGNLLAYAQQYASSGTVPTGLPKGTFGAVANLAKELPKPEGTLVDNNTGTKPNISDAKIDGLSALYDISQKVQQLKELDQNRFHGVVSGSLGYVFGSEAQQRYVDLRTEIIDLLSRARTGAALTASEEAFYANQLPGRFAEPFGIGVEPSVRIDNFANKINDTLKTKLQTNGVSIFGYSKVKTAGGEYTVGEIVTNGAGQVGRVNADGSITIIEE